MERLALARLKQPTYGEPYAGASAIAYMLRCLHWRVWSGVHMERLALERLKWPTYEDSCADASEVAYIWRFLRWRV